MDREVNFWCMRHGKRRNGSDELSDLGLEQVTAAARQHLQQVRFRTAYYSGFRRAQQTVTGVLTELDQMSVDLPIIHCPGLSYEDAYVGTVPQHFDEDAARQAVVQKKGGSITVWDMLEEYPPMWFYRGQMVATLRDLAYRVTHTREARDIGYTEFNIFVAGHTPLLESAVKTPKSQELLAQADIIRYPVIVPEGENNFPWIADSAHYRAPAVEEQ